MKQHKMLIKKIQFLKYPTNTTFFLKFEVSSQYLYPEI